MSHAPDLSPGGLRTWDAGRPPAWPPGGARAAAVSARCLRRCHLSRPEMSSSAVRRQTRGTAEMNVKRSPGQTRGGSLRRRLGGLSPVQGGVACPGSSPGGCGCRSGAAPEPPGSTRTAESRGGGSRPRPRAARLPGHRAGVSGAARGKPSRAPMTVRCQTPVPGADVRGGAGGRPASASPSRARSRLKPFPSVCPQRRSRANGHVHSAQQHPGTSQSRGAARRVPGREESEASEAAHGADPGKKPQRRAAPQARVAAVDVTLRLDRFPLRGSPDLSALSCVCVCV